MREFMKGGYCRVPNCFDIDVSPKVKAKAMGVFVWIVTRVTRQDFVKDGLLLHRGQMAVYMTELANVMGMSYHCLRTVIDALCAAQLLAKERARQVASPCVVITVCNFDRYNGDFFEGGTTSGTTNGTTSGTLSKEEGNKEEGGKEEGVDVVGASSSSVCVSGVDDGKVRGGRVPVGELAERMLAETAWVAAYERNHGLEHSEMVALVRRFVRHVEDTGASAKVLSDALRHFCFWHSKRLEAAEREVRRRREAEEASRAKVMKCEEERRRSEEVYRVRMTREAEESSARIMGEIRAKAAAGDRGAIEALRVMEMRAAMDRNKGK